MGEPQYHRIHDALGGLTAATPGSTIAGRTMRTCLRSAASRRAWVVVCACACACRPQAATPSAPPTATEVAAPTPSASTQLDPAARMQALEARLLDATGVHIEFEITANVDGAGTAGDTTLRGVLSLTRDGRMTLAARGTFAGQVGEVHFECDGTTMRGTAGKGRFELPCAPELGPAVLLGLTRMGVLHNIARLWSARPPDHADGGVDEWVTTAAHARARDDHDDALGFEIAVDGQRVGSAVLELDAVGVPHVREQVVDFPGGAMHVVERYEAFAIDGDTPTAAPASTSAPPVGGARG